MLDNRTGLDDATPRAVRYRIDQAAGTATLLQSISDPDVPVSYCCGSARLLPNQDWLIDWGQGSLQGTGRLGDMSRMATVNGRVPPGATTVRRLMRIGHKGADAVVPGTRWRASPRRSTPASM